MYTGYSINDSPVIVANAAAALTGAAGKNVKFDTSGNVVLCSTKGEKANGMLVLSTPDTVAANDGVTIQIKDIGKGIAGAAFKRGAELTTDISGKFIAAVTGDYVNAIANEDASGDGAIVSVQLVKYKI